MNSSATYTYGLPENKTLFMLFVYYVFVMCISVQIFFTTNPQPYHPAAQVWLPTEAKQGWAGQYLNGRLGLLLEEVLVRPARGAHPVVCVGPNAPV